MNSDGLKNPKSVFVATVQTERKMRPIKWRQVRIGFSNSPIKEKVCDVSEDREHMKVKSDRRGGNLVEATVTPCLLKNLVPFVLLCFVCSSIEDDDDDEEEQNDDESFASFTTSIATALCAPYILY